MSYTPGERAVEAEVRPRQTGRQVMGQIAADRDDTYNNALTRDFRDLYDNLTRMQRRPPSRLSPVRIPAYAEPIGRYFEYRNAFRHGAQMMPDEHDPDLLPGPRDPPRLRPDLQQHLERRSVGEPDLSDWRWNDHSQRGPRR